MLFKEPVYAHKLHGVIGIVKAVHQIKLFSGGNIHLAESLCREHRFRSRCQHIGIALDKFTAVLVCAVLCFKNENSVPYPHVCGNIGFCRFKRTVKLGDRSAVKLTDAKTLALIDNHILRGNSVSAAYLRERKDVV